ncbi:hypothetical protein SUGI_0828740 [Cryptomeria japonica]|nr:hypothetical protein SUGI_0828740 [Cryptomeria japonica]
MADFGRQDINMVLGISLLVSLSVMDLGFAPNHDPLQCLNRGEVCKKCEIEMIWFRGDSSLMPRGVLMHHGRDICAPSTLVVAAITKPTIVTLTEEVEKEVDHNELIFVVLGLIGHFRGILPSLGDLHKWILDHWVSIVDDSVQIYPHARGFFVVVFQTMEDRNKIIGGYQWCWEDSNPLMLKLWHPTINSESKSFDRSPMSIRLLNISLQF